MMGNTITISFIVISNVVWTDYFSNPMKVYAGMGLIIGSIIFLGAVMGNFLSGVSTKRGITQK